jgi:hypothetical protein
MTMRTVLFLLTLSLSSCVLPQDAPLPELPPPAATTGTPATPVEPIPPTSTLIAFTPPAVPPAPTKLVARVERLPNLPAPKAEPAPATMIQEAQKQAQVQPQARGYHGQSATQRWIWQPGKLYVVYVAPSQTTKIVLPPGELLISKAFLDPDVWDVQSYRVGTETQTQDVVFVRPMDPKETKEGKGAKDVDLALLTEQGHSFDVHLKVGAVGMFAVTWETPTVPSLLLEDPTLRSGR